MLDQGTGKWKPHIWQTAVVYTEETAEGLKLFYELEQAQHNWAGPDWTYRFEVEDAQPSSETTRHVSLSFFRDEQVGILWKGSDGNLYFVEGSASGWAEGNTPTVDTVVDSGIGAYADFDYDPMLGIQVVAYEGSESPPFVYVKVWNGVEWMNVKGRDSDGNEIDSIDQQDVGSSGNSFLDMAVSEEGYIYIAYSKNGSIYCAILDFFQGNRP